MADCLNCGEDFFLTFEFPEPVYIHALLIVLDIIEEGYNGLRIKITNNPNYDDPVSLNVDNICSETGFFVDLSETFGIELWPHCTGRYIHI